MIKPYLLYPVQLDLQEILRLVELGEVFENTDDLVGDIILFIGRTDGSGEIVGGEIGFRTTADGRGGGGWGFSVLLGASGGVRVPFLRDDGSIDAGV